MLDFILIFLSVLAVSALFLIDNMALYLVLKMGPPSVYDFSSISSDEISLDEVRTLFGGLLMHSSSYPMVDLWGKIKPPISKAFKSYMGAGLKNRNQESAPPKAGAGVMACFCSHTAREHKRIGMSGVIYWLSIGGLFLVLMLRVLEIFPLNSVLPVVLSVFMGISVIVSKVLIITSCRWECAAPNLLFKGFFNERSIALHDIASLESSLVPYTLVLNIHTKDGAKVTVQSKELKKLLPLYDCIVHHEPRLKITGEGQAPLVPSRDSVK